MKELKETYTTAEKKEADKLLPEKEQSEQNKVILSNDAFAVCEFIEHLIKKIEHARISNLR